MKKLKQVKKPVKYLEARLDGKTKKEAEKDAYGTNNHNSTQIESTGVFKNALNVYLLSNKEVAKEHNKNM